MLQFNGHDAEFELILICYFVLQQRTDIILPLWSAYGFHQLAALVKFLCVCPRAFFDCYVDNPVY